MKQDMILILDLGSEENPRLAREIRALGVYSEIHPHDITADELAALPNVKGIILNGGPNRVVDGVEIDAAKEIYNCSCARVAGRPQGRSALARGSRGPQGSAEQLCVPGLRRAGQLEYGELHRRPGGADPPAGG